MKGCDEDDRIEEYNGKRSGGRVGGGDPSFYFPIVSPWLELEEESSEAFFSYLSNQEEGWIQTKDGGALDHSA